MVQPSILGIEHLGPIAHERPDVIAHYLASIVDSSDDAILSKDLNGTITSWNAAAERLFGYTASEAIGQPVTMLIPVDRQGEEPLILERIRSGARIEHFETVRVRKDGSTVEISLTISPVRAPEGNIIGASKIARDIRERREAQGRQQFLINELQHRTQNLFTVIKSVAKVSLAEPLSLVEAAKVFDGRLNALAETHRLLADAAFEGAQLSEIVRREFAPFSDHLSLSGDDILVHTLAAQQFALTVHELTTNAIKYGALSAPTGRVAIAFDVERAKGATLSFLWKETGGPKVSPPKRKGFGSVILLEGARQFAEHIALEFESDGLRYAARFPLAAIEAKPIVGSNQRRS
jgi:PAS domain S-box-containing protein